MSRDIASVREHLRALRNKALLLHPEETAFIDGLYEVWDSTLAEIGDVTPLPRYKYVEHLERASLNSPGTILEWMDAYPSHVHGMFS